MNEPSENFKAIIVSLILSRNTEEAIRSLSKVYDVDVPKLKVGQIKGKKKAAGVYVSKKKTILVSKGDNLWDPFIILHEFYHYLRDQNGEQRGNEKFANAFAQDYINALKSLNII